MAERIMTVEPAEELRLCPEGYLPETVRSDVMTFLRQTPGREPFLPKSEAQFYGATHIIARALGGDQPPPTHVRWSHGWAFYYDVPGINTDEFAKLVRWSGDDNWMHLCRNEVEAGIYRKAGAHAVVVAGLPFFYLPESDIKRLPKTVLVMPPHSTWLASVKISERELLKLARNRHPGAQLCVSLSPSCCLGTKWIQVCEEMQVPWIAGAHPYDAASLSRMKHLMSGFEVILTPKLGSHVIYGAASGAKIDFVKGISFDIIRQEAVANLTAARRSPSHAHLIEEERLRLELMLQEGGADCRTWALAAGGAHFRKDPATIARLLGWTHDKVFPELNAGNESHLEGLGWSGHNEAIQLIAHLENQVAERKRQVQVSRSQLKSVENELLRTNKRLELIRNSCAWKCFGKPVFSFERRLREWFSKAPT